MNLEDLANFVCASTGYVDSDDQAAVRTFLQARDRMIYDAALWKSALLMTVIALDPVNNLDHKEGIVVLPSAFHRPVGVRTEVNAVRVNGMEEYFRFDADKFTEQGNPFEFAELQPIFAVWRGISSIALSCDAGDPNVSIKIVYRDNDVVKTSEFTLNGDGNGNLKYITPAGNRMITISGGGTDDANGDYTFDTSALGVWKNSNNYALSVEAGNWVIRRPDDSAIVYFAPVATNVWQGNPDSIPAGVAQGIAPAPTAVFPASGRVEIIVVYKSASQGDVRVGYSTGEPVLPGSVIGSIDAAATSSAAFCRLRVFGIPSVAGNLRVLGKERYQPLIDDRQEQTVRNSENCLIAFARGDLLRRGGENGAAQAAYQEAAALLQQLKDIEAVQAANNQRIIPDAGYGPDYGLGPYIRPYF